jgi:nucleoside-triphosphatase
MNPQRIFLTGEPGCGKTTVVLRICESLRDLGKKPGGVISSEIRQRGVRTGFKVEDLITQEIGTLAQVGERAGPHVGKYTVNLQDIERVGVSAIKRALEEADVVIVDEIGPMELHSKPFILVVENALASSKHLVATIHKRASHPLVTAIKSNPAYKVIEVTPENREQLPRSIVDELSLS